MFAIILCLTLGLAPFQPEPHLVGKWRWLLGGAEGMAAMDWFDLVLHTFPFILLIVFTAKFIQVRREKESPGQKN
ncbi:MAG: hypothetical protein LC664_06350 [Flavobacteriales bacterium]|nr:hypothetical protein [Flavobacteriales bacterium]